MLKKLSSVALLCMWVFSAAQAGWGYGYGGGRGGNAGAGQSGDTTNLSATESRQLIYLREEEKVARDVYDRLYEVWGLFVFDNISAAEQNHMDAVLTQLNNHGLEDPALQPGVFSDTALQSLHDSLLNRGALSPIDALQTGAMIEEVDMQDIKAMRASTDHDDLISLYDRLACGSRNHLRAFVRQIENRGVVYQAQSLAQDEVDAIVDSPMERGCGRRY
ncbi:MAG: DUF2202 domain-containing protein [Candidatus Thiodiazotropha sp.]